MGALSVVCAEHVAQSSPRIKIEMVLTEYPKTRLGDLSLSLRSRRLRVRCVFVGLIRHTQQIRELSVFNGAKENAEDAETPRTQRLDTPPGNQKALAGSNEQANALVCQYSSWLEFSAVGSDYRACHASALEAFRQHLW
jgi:hypothetical protein